MTLPTFAVAFDLSALEPAVLVWPLLFGLGIYLVLTAPSQPWGRPKADLAERLRRLDVDERLRAELTEQTARPIFASRALERLVRPVLDDVGRLLQAVLGRVGLAGGHELERKLREVRPGVSPVQFLGEKVGVGFVGLALFPVMESLGIHPFGSWPVWLWAVGLVVGFLAPDWQLDALVSARRTRCVLELPTILDLLTLATSAGLALEQALALAAGQSRGVLAGELQRASREVALGQKTLVEALEGIAERNDVPELTGLVSQVRAAHEQGMPLVAVLSVQAEALREQKRLRILEEGGRASVRMVLPVALFILPVLFVVLLAPAVIELMHLGG